MPSKGLMKMKELEGADKDFRCVVLVFQGSFFCRGPMWPPASRYLQVTCYILLQFAKTDSRADQTVIYLNGTWQSSFPFVMTKWPNVMRIVFQRFLSAAFIATFPFYPSAQILPGIQMASAITPVKSIGALKSCHKSIGCALTEFPYRTLVKSLELRRQWRQGSQGSSHS